MVRSYSISYLGMPARQSGSSPIHIFGSIQDPTAMMHVPIMKENDIFSS
ncbi:hypothetical protein Lalb_Chr11g0063221 [Lupinus albus]|uniref:Uncharacterized protein n=1 Tax=Lupinus albus TaxID=3870 RepID=A0A6A4PQS3_LUPAL|nr:hypothetical protein Lalb_Chr11g0063221 [Lupinus albus]